MATTFVRYELLRALRNRRFYVFSLGFPLVLFWLIAGPNSNEKDLGGTGIPATLYFMVGMTAFAQHLRDSGHLRDGVSWQEARDVLWTHNSVELWDLLVRQRGWSTKRYGKWMGRQLVAALL